jgi:hypothetical protein
MILNNPKLQAIIEICAISHLISEVKVISYVNLSLELDSGNQHAPESNLARKLFLQNFE